jgi:hypothetical protein
MGIRNMSPTVDRYSGDTALAPSEPVENTYLTSSGF